MKPLHCIVLWFVAFAPVMAGNPADEKLTRIFEDNKLMGLSVVAVFENEIVYAAQRGMANVETKSLINENTLFRFASVSKVVTAMAMLKLHEKGLINPDDDISDILGYEVRNPHYPHTPITARMLLSHTSTIMDGETYSRFLVDETYNNPAPPSIREILHPGGAFFHETIWLNKEPGKFFNYSNLAYGLAGTVIEKASRQRFDHFVNEHILMPLNINGGFNVVELTDIANLATLYRMPDGEWVPQADSFYDAMPKAVDYTQYVPGTNALLFAPQGGLRISPADLAKIMIVLMNKGSYGNRQILTEKSVALMEQQCWLFNGYNGNNYNNLFNAWGIGLQIISAQTEADVVIPGYRMYGHAGLAYGLVSGMFYHAYPDFGLIIVINGKAGNYTNGEVSAFHREEEALYQFLYDEIITPLINK